MAPRENEKVYNFHIREKAASSESVQTTEWVYRHLVTSSCLICKVYTILLLPLLSCPLLCLCQQLGTPLLATFCCQIVGVYGLYVIHILDDF